MRKLLINLGLIVVLLFQFSYTQAQVGYMFPGSTLVGSNEDLTMKNWLGSNSSPNGRLLYRASRDGFSSYTFHNLCDNQGPTIVLIKTSYGTVFGGYASSAWGSYNNNYYYSQYLQAEGSFLFNLTTGLKGNKGGISGPSNQYGIYTDPNYGPTFGGGHDLYISSDMRYGYVYPGYSYNTLDGSSYGSQQAGTALIGPGLYTNYYSNSFPSGFIEDIEVYGVEYNYSAPIVAGRNLKRYIDAAGTPITITAAMVDSASSDVDGIASITIDKTSFDCSNVGSGSVSTIVPVGTANQNTHSIGGGYNPNTNEFYYPEWAGNYVYVYNQNRQQVRTFYSSQSQMMQLWMNYGSNDYYTANWSYQTVTKLDQNNNVIWSYYTNSLASGVSSDGTYVYVTGHDYYSSNNNPRKVIVLNASNGAFVREIPLPGIVYTYGGLVVANNHIYISGYAESFSTIPNTYNAIHIFDMSGNYISSTATPTMTYSTAFDGEVMWISDYYNNTSYGFKISDGNAYLNAGSGNSIRLTVTDNLGYTSFKNYRIQIYDTIVPVISLNGNSIEVVPLGGTWNDPNVSAIENCPKPVSITGTVDVNNKGKYPLSYQMKDAGGNLSNTLNRMVYVGAYDTTAPSVLTKNFTINLGANTSGSLTISDIDNGTTDVNGLKSLTISKSSFDCSNLGANTVTLTAEDYYGNIASATAIVTVEFNPTYTISKNYNCVYGTEGTAEVILNSANQGSSTLVMADGYLHKFDVNTGQNTLVAYTGLSNVNALAFSPSGELYAYYYNNFYKINTTTGQATYVGYSSYCGTITAMAFDNNGTLYGNDDCGYFFRINTSNGNLQYAGYNGYYLESMQFDPISNTLYASNSNSLYTIDKNSGSISYFNSVGGNSIREILFNSAGDLYAITNYYPYSQVVKIDKTNGQVLSTTNTSLYVQAGVRVNGGLNYLWSNGQTTSKATNLTAGVYTVIISSGIGCSVTDTVVMDACAPVVPTITLTSSAEQICEGANVSMTADATTTIPAQLQNTQLNDPTLVAYYKFNETSGTNVNDESSNNLDGTFSGYMNSSWSNSGALANTGGSYNNGGYGNYVDVQSNTQLNSIQNSFTIESWVYNSDNYNNTIVDKGNYNMLFQVFANGTSGLGFYNYNIGWYYDYSYIPLNQWVHVAVTWDNNTHLLTFIVNGVQTAQHYVYGSLYFDNGPLNIGRQSPYSCQCNFMDGQIDELRIWNVAKSPSSINANRNAELNSAPAPLTHTYSWSPSTGLNTTNGANVIATPSVTTTYTVTATNSNGASSTASKTIVVNSLASNLITVNGSTSICPGGTVNLQADSGVGYTYDWKLNGNSIANANNSNFVATTSGTYTVEITSGPNCSIITNPVTITIEDTENPVAIAQNISRTITSATGAISISAADINNGSYDNCAISSITLVGTTSLDCSNPSGIYNVTLLVTDASGNSSSANATISLTNNCNTAPVAICKSITLPANGITANANAIDFNNGSTDAENDALTFSVSPAGPYALGTTQVVLTVSDPAGLSSTCNASITVVDSTSPNVLVNNITLSLNSDGNTSLAIAQIDNGSNDNVGIVNLSLSKTNFDCSNLGLNTVALTAVDAAGNTSSANAVVTVIDEIAPSIVPTYNQVYCYLPTNMYSINNISASDNCGISNISYTVSGATSRSGVGFDASGLFNEGINTVTWMVTDASGNFSTSSVEIKVSALPVASIETSNANTFCNTITLTANSTSTGNTQYMWTNGATTQSIELGADDLDGAYSVYVINENGCNSINPATYVFNKQNLVNSYTILAYQKVDLHENNYVQSGSIGVLSSKGQAEFKKNVVVNGIGSFVKAPRIKTNGNVNIPNKVYGVASVSLPTMFSNTSSTKNLSSYTIAQNTTKTLNGNYKEVTIKKGAIATLTGTIFGKITIEEGANVTFTSPVINISELKVGKGKNSNLTKLNFANNTNVLMDGKVTIQENCIVNDQNKVVTFYFGDKSSANNHGCNRNYDNDDDGYEGQDDKFYVEGGNTSVVANVYMTSGKIKAKSCSDNAVYMTGLYISSKVQSEGKNVYWNSFSCSNGNSNRVVESAIASDSEALDMFEIIAYPNPTISSFSYKVETFNSEYVDFKLFDVAGRLIVENLNANPNETYKLDANLAPGVYMLQADQGDHTKVIRVVKAQ